MSRRPGAASRVNGRSRTPSRDFYPVYDQRVSFRGERREPRPPPPPRRRSQSRGRPRPQAGAAARTRDAAYSVTQDGQYVTLSSGERVRTTSGKNPLNYAWRSVSGGKNSRESQTFPPGIYSTDSYNVFAGIFPSRITDPNSDTSDSACLSIRFQDSRVGRTGAACVLADGVEVEDVLRAFDDLVINARNSIHAAIRPT
uniref:Uncharacterized protein n=1 Tax=Frankliniella occidentalis associated negev-like virus 2 TaxID=2767263 RepID=A0A7G9IR69_9VIRU|nr:hypothetical protein [Frankliniella occidentalis associated negev-like virus 2]